MKNKLVNVISGLSLFSTAFVMPANAQTCTTESLGALKTQLRAELNGQETQLVDKYGPKIEGIFANLGERALNEGKVDKELVVFPTDKANFDGIHPDRVGEMKGRREHTSIFWDSNRWGWEVLPNEDYGGNSTEDVESFYTNKGFTVKHSNNYVIENDTFHLSFRDRSPNSEFKGISSNDRVDSPDRLRVAVCPSDLERSCVEGSTFNLRSSFENFNGSIRYNDDSDTKTSYATYSNDVEIDFTTFPRIEGKISRLSCDSLNEADMIRTMIKNRGEGVEYAAKILGGIL